LLNSYETGVSASTNSSGIFRRGSGTQVVITRAGLKSAGADSFEDWVQGRVVLADKFTGSERLLTGGEND
jgi:hypothetical protein